MIDEHGDESPGYRRKGNSIVHHSLARRVPGAAANAPKRNVLVVLGYLLVGLLAGGLLLTAL